MFGFGVFLCYLAVPAPLTAAILGAPWWLIVLLPAGLLAVGLACMGIGNAIEWGPLPPRTPTQQRFDVLLAEAKEISGQLWREREEALLLRRPLPDQAELRARFDAKMAEAEALLGSRR